MWFQLIDNLHGSHLGCATERPGGEAADECLHGVTLFGECPTYATDQVDDMTVELGFFVEIEMDSVAGTAEVVTGQIDQHRMFGILFGVSQEGLDGGLVIGRIASASCCPRDGVDGSPLAFDLAVRFGRRPYQAEAPKVQVEKVGRRVDVSQCPVEHEVIAPVALDEAS